MIEHLKLSGKAIIERRTLTDEFIDRIEINNLIVNTGKEQVAKLINGVSTINFNAIAVGTSSTSPTIGDTTLGVEIKRQAATISYLSANQAVFETTLSFTSAYNITEAGILNNAVSGGVLLNRLTFSARAVSSLIKLYIKIIITVS